MENNREYSINFIYGGINVLLTRASVSFDMFEGYPVVSCELPHNDQVSNIMAIRDSGGLLSYEGSLVIKLKGIKTLVELGNLVISRFTPYETESGYRASLSLAPAAAIYSATFPGSFYLNRFDVSIKESIQAVMNYYNSNTLYASRRLQALIYEARDSVSLMATRFVNVSFFDMIREICKFHGLMAAMDMRQNIRVFSMLKSSTSSFYLSKFNVEVSNITVDALQTLVG